MNPRQNRYEIKDLFKEAAKKLEVEFSEIQKTTSHSAIKGYLWEEVFRVFLRKYLPDSLEVTRGFVIDSHGEQSKEIDIIISDKQKTPVFYSGGDARIVPVEAVYAVIEIKTKINNTELNNIFSHLNSVKKLKKDAYVEVFPKRGILNLKQIMNLFDNVKVKDGIKPEDYEIEIEYDTQVPMYGNMNKIWPIHYFVFAFDSVNLFTLKKNLIKKSKNLSHSKRIDMICVLNKGLIANKSDKGFLPYSTKNTKLEVLENKPYNLMTFFGLMANVLLAAELPGNIKYTDYMPQN